MSLSHNKVENEVSLAAIEIDMRDLISKQIELSLELREYKEKTEEEIKNMLLAFIEVSDIFSALKKILDGKKNDPEKISKNWVKQFRKACRRYDRVLQDCGLQEIQVCPGKRVKHGEHIVEKYSKTAKRENDTIEAEVRKGYIWRGKLLRAAGVKAVKNG